MTPDETGRVRTYPPADGPRPVSPPPRGQKADWFDRGWALGVAAERARIRAAVEGLLATHTHEPTTFCIPAYCPHALRAAVLRAIGEGER